jgi:AraC-like DNA-binding protein
VDLSNTIKQYIEMHFDDKMLSLESIADFLGLSVGYLCRQFKRQTGTTVASAIQDLRVKEARRLLQTTKLPVKDIVSRIGYMDHSSFSRSFKAKTGVSPQEYREGTPLPPIYPGADGV